MTWKAPRFSRRLTLYGCEDKLCVPLVGLWGVVNYVPLLVLGQYGSEQFIPATHGLNCLEFEYGGSGYGNQLIEMSMIWKEPKQMDLRKHICDVTPGYSAWKLNRIKYLMLPLVDETLQPAYLLLERVPTEAKVLRSKLKLKGK